MAFFKPTALLSRVVKMLQNATLTKEASIECSIPDGTRGSHRIAMSDSRNRPNAACSKARSDQTPNVLAYGMPLYNAWGI